MSKQICQRCHRPSDTPYCTRCNTTASRTAATEKKAEPFYKSAAWLKARAYKLVIDPLCQDCKERGITRPAQMVDHIEEIKDGGALLDIDNLRSLCFACHNKKTAKSRTRRGGANWYG